MKRSWLLGVLVAAGLMVGASRTQVTLNQISSAPAPLSPAGYGVVVMPNGSLAVAQFSGLSLNTSTNPPTLSAAPQASHLVSSVTVVQAAGATWPTPGSPCSDLSVIWNGIYQTPGASFDYVLDSPPTSITFNGTIFPQVGDVLQMKCLQ